MIIRRHALRTYEAAALILSLTAFLVVSFLGAGRAGAADRPSTVTNMRHWSTPSYTRVVIDLDHAPASYTYRLLKKDTTINKPRRLYVDITTATASSTLPKSLPINDGLLKRARTGQYNQKTVRVVLDIETIEDFKIFHLNEPYRIVMDVTGTRGVVPASSVAVTPSTTAPDASDAGPSLSRQLGLKTDTIVIDAGHGGRDPGAIGKHGLKEKDVTLKVARLVEGKLKGKFSRVIMTRSTDVFIPLEERTAIANKNDADLFVSIHVNASPRRSASGVETYILNISNNDEARRVAARENSTSTRSVSDLEYILADLIKTAKTNDSSELAGMVNTSLVSGLRRKYRGVNSNGVKGAPFYVLVGTKMPSILVETSFISNATEEKRLKDPRYLDEVADGIVDGILKYADKHP